MPLAPPSLLSSALAVLKPPALRTSHDSNLSPQVTQLVFVEVNFGHISKRNV